MHEAQTSKVDAIYLHQVNILAQDTKYAVQYGGGPNNIWTEEQIVNIKKTNPLLKVYIVGGLKNNSVSSNKVIEAIKSEINNDVSIALLVDVGDETKNNTEFIPSYISALSPIIRAIPYQVITLFSYF